MRKIFELVGSVTCMGIEYVNNGLKVVGKSAENADKALTKFGRQAQKIGTNLSKYVTAPIIGGAAAIAIAADRVGEYAISLQKMEQQSGMSTDTLQEFAFVAKKAGIDVSNINQAIVLFSKQLSGTEIGSDKVAGAMKKLGINVYGADGKLRDMNELFPEMLKRLNSIPNITQRNALALQIFGRGAKELLPILNMNSTEIDNLRARARELGIVMSGEAIAAAVDYRSKMIDLKEQAGALWRNLAIDLIPILRDTLFPVIQNQIIPAIKSFADRVGDAIKWFTNLDKSTRNVILGIVAFAAAIGPVTLAIGKFILIGKSLIVTISLIRMAMAGLAVSMATNPFTAVIVGAGALAAALIAIKMASIAAEEQLNKRLRIEGLMSGIDGLNTSVTRLRLNSTSMVNVNKEMGGAIGDLTKLAEELGFTFDENDKNRIQELNNVRQQLIKTRDLTKAVSAYNKEMAKTAAAAAAAAAGGGGPIGLTQDEVNAAEKTIQGYTDKVSALTLDRLDAIESEKIASIAAVNAMVGTEEQKARAITSIKRYAALQSETAVADEKDKIKNAAKEVLENRDTFEVEWTKKLAEQAGERSFVLESERDEAIKNAKEKGYDIAAINEYYNKEIEKSDKETAEKSKATWRDKVNNVIETIGQYTSQVVGLFTASTENKITANDNWYEQEKAAIEKSTMNETEKKKKQEELDKRYNEKRRKMQHEKAVEEKAGAIFSAIINTAAAVVKALPNVVLSVMAGIMGAAQLALIAAQPIPFKRGGMVKGGRGGIMAQIGEGAEDELVFPLKTGFPELIGGMVNAFKQLSLSPSPAMAGAGGVIGRQAQNHWHIGVLVADDRGIKELERRQAQFRISESQRMGANG